jgi:DNA-binding beta-propeller fold protein YncE
MSVKIFAGFACAVALAGAAALAQAQPAPAYAVVDRIKGPDGGFDYVNFDPILGRIYISRTDGALALDVKTNAVNGHLAPAQHSHAALPVDEGRAVLITDAGSDSAHLVDAQSGALLADIPTGQKPDGADYDPATGLALVMNGHSGDVTLIDVKARKAVGAIAVGGGLEQAQPDGAGKLFINVEDQNRIAVVDLKARTKVGYYALNGCEGPTGLAYAPEAGVLISACANKVAKVLSAADGHEIASLAIGAGPDQLAYDPARRLVFIPCGRDGVLDVVAVRGPNDAAVVETVPTQVGARTGAVDPATGKLYLPTAHYSPSPTGGRPTADPGSFVILVVAPKS